MGEEHATAGSITASTAARREFAMRSLAYNCTNA
jgi:hypothetical protein